MGEALAAYRQNHQGFFPPELGDLIVEKMLSDPNSLKCPAAIAAGLGSVRNPNQVTDPGAADGKVFGYNYEISQKDTAWEGAGYGFSLYRFKQLQMKSLVGQYMPVVRCSHHGPDRRLNLAVDGSIYESGLYWESSFVDILPGSRLAPELVAMSHLPMAQLVRPRSNQATPAMLDLRPWYNARFEDPWVHSETGQELTSFTLDLTAGLFASQTIQFEPAGIVQLNGKVGGEGEFRGYNRLMYPTNVAAIRIGRTFKVMHVLGGVVHRSPANTIVARLQFVAEGIRPPRFWEWRYGTDVSQLSFGPSDRQNESELATVAWTGDFEKEREFGRRAQLFHLRFVNPEPDQVVTQINFGAGDGVSSPFIAAITLE